MHINPSVVLVQTQLPENIGAAARAMLNFGLTDLRLVSPRDGWPNKRAYDLAAHAGKVLDDAKLFSSVSEAVADCTRVYAATARAREMVKPVFTPAQAMESMHASCEPTAWLFGPERTGLSNDDVALADAIITIPAHAEFTSLNVGQSVVVLAYQYFALHKNSASSYPTTGPEASPVGSKSPLASKQELQVFFNRLEKELDDVDFWKVDDKKPKMWLNLRNIFSRAGLTEQEVRTLHGVIAELKRGRSSD